MLPNARGFDYFFGMHSGSHDYFPKAEKNKLFRNKSPIKKIEHPYLTDWFTHEAIGQMTRRRETLFLFPLTQHASHPHASEGGRPSQVFPHKRQAPPNLRGDAMVHGP
jgi:hypothetical protein